MSVQYTKFHPSHSFWVLWSTLTLKSPITRYYKNVLLCHIVRRKNGNWVLQRKLDGQAILILAHTIEQNKCQYKEGEGKRMKWQPSHKKLTMLCLLKNRFYHFQTVNDINTNLYLFDFSLLLLIVPFCQHLVLMLVMWSHSSLFSRTIWMSYPWTNLIISSSLSWRRYVCIFSKQIEA